ncbi:hypothetical protein [Glutamicibacter sp.]|jgi:hypothetical protein|uniref:hypothetical protein n=1 Tax=Glutamicibacter sp. TaxID=1931995 RepID=UPI002FD94267
MARSEAEEWSRKIKAHERRKAWRDQEAIQLLALQEADTKAQAAWASSGPLETS